MRCGERPCDGKAAAHAGEPRCVRRVRTWSTHLHATQHASGSLSKKGHGSERACSYGPRGRSSQWRLGRQRRRRWRWRRRRWRRESRRAENQARIHKLFHCILNYIVPNCRVYKMFMRDFGQNGIDVYRFIMVYGNIPTPPRALRTNEDAWSRMTMDTLNLSYTLYNYILWAEIILEQGRLLTKTGVQMKEKFLSGLPSFFNAEKAQMRHDNLHVYPATYGGIPEFCCDFACCSCPSKSRTTGHIRINEDLHSGLHE